MCRNAKILLVDDEPRFCDSLKFLLSEEGWEIDTALSGRNALGLLSQKTFDLAILDIVLPDINGLQIMDAIFSEGRKTPVIVITGDTSRKWVDVALSQGAFDFFAKPFELEELLKSIHQAFGSEEASRDSGPDRQNPNALLPRNNILQTLPDIVYSLDTQGKFTFVSHAVLPLLGFQSRNLLGKHYTHIVHESDLEKSIWAFNERRTGERAGHSLELRLKVSPRESEPDLTGAGYKRVELKSVGIYEQQGFKNRRQYLGTHGVIRDITRRIQEQEWLRDEEKREALMTLSGGIAHQFNNMLSVIITSLDLLETELPHESPGTNRIRAMRKSASRMTHLVRKMLAFSGWGMGKAVTISLSDLVERLLASQENLFQPGIKIETDLPPELWKVRVAPDQMELVLYEVLLNASEAIETSGVIRISCRNVVLDDRDVGWPPDARPGPYVILSITDNGKGMDEQTRKRIFDPFFTKQFQGRGLGMAAAAGITKGHGGWIAVDSEPGRGTTVRIYLPEEDGDRDNRKTPYSPVKKEINNS